ncbi:AAA family ATPase [Paenibacillus dauci]|uniref:AAA family ATPase n=1 Tax=Paenibacillus dauci TaxID=1567106 RepID=UPI0006198990|nr:SMC family ATPase [Paenibacillus dauci]
MKPITLKLSGLQSYREQQEIDFTVLCETGLFGIFGPTGSGKSTVLDAITLALYGKVERAQNGTQGILNHSEDAVFVSFSFELLSDLGPHTYRVERRFKRTGDHTVSNTMSRFIECLPDGDRVMADKLGDVTRCVEEYIGLKMDDFTRAVVLPQGKFAEFLSLKGSDRRQMLQRLFHLERYGDRLMQKLSQRVKETDNQLGRLAAEQAGLGDASAEAVKLSKERLQAAVQEAEQVRLQLQEITVQAERLSRIRELMKEQSILQVKLNDLDQHEADIQALEQQIHGAAAANILLPLLDAWKTALARLQQEESRSAMLQDQLQQAAQAAAHAAERENEARQALSQNEPRLVLRIEQLQQALKLQQECSRLEKSQTLLNAQLEQTQQQLAELRRQSEHEQTMLDKAEKRREELSIQLKACEVRNQDRKELQDAQQRLSALDAARVRLQDIQQEHEGYRQADQRAGEAWRALEKQQLQRSHEENRFYQAASRLLQQHQQNEQQISKFQNVLRDHEQQYHQASRAAESHRLAAVLAASLQEGEPCAVCGSVHHPDPAALLAEASGSADSHAEQLNQLEKLQQEARQLNDHIRSRRFELDNILGEWEENVPYSQSVNVPEQADSELGSITHTPSEDPETITDSAAMNTWLATARQQNDIMERELNTLKQEIKSWRQQQREWSQRTTALQTEQQSAARLLEQSVIRLNAAQQTVNNLLQDWQSNLAHLTEESAREGFARIAALDEQAEKIREGLEKSTPYIEERQKALRHYEQQQNQLDRQHIQDSTRYEGEQKLLQEKKNRLQEWIGSDSADQLIGQVESELARYRQESENCVRQLREAEQRQQQSAQALALSEQSAASAREQADQTGQQWQQALDASPFASADDVNAARMEEQQLQLSRQRIDLHREQQRELTLHLREVETKLDGQSITEQQWEEIQQRWTEARQADETALENRAKASRDFEDLEHRHVRWLELENERTTLAVEAGHLSKLQASMRGNAFVEYIAEEQLMQVSLAASERLRFLTKQRYSLEVDSGGGFVICDNGNGGIRRPVSTLSGGETFLTSLSLALALSAQIQLRGRYPLQFFFLDEGFGTLDPELLDTVVTSLEKLHTDRLSVGIISHVPELRMRLPRKLIIVPAEQAGSGSKVMLEKM